MTCRTCGKPCHAANGGNCCLCVGKFDEACAPCEERNVAMASCPFCVEELKQRQLEQLETKTGARS